MLRRTFQSSCTYHACDHHRGSHVVTACVYSALLTEPSRNAANAFPVFGVNGKSVPPNRYDPDGSAATSELYRVRIVSQPTFKVCAFKTFVRFSWKVKSSPTSCDLERPLLS